jgi:DNA-binding response OmpR family regulator
VAKIVLSMKPLLTLDLSLNPGIDTPTRAEDDRSLMDDIKRSGLTQSSHSHKILVVDDEQDIVFTLKTILNEAGFSVDAFTNPSVAFEMFRPEEYELIILDIRMPGINGFELYMKLLEKDSSIKVLFLTAVNEFSMYAKFKNSVSPMSGKRYYLQKPVDLTKLLQRVDDMLSL